MVKPFGVFHSKELDGIRNFLSEIKTFPDTYELRIARSQFGLVRMMVTLDIMNQDSERVEFGYRNGIYRVSHGARYEQ